MKAKENNYLKCFRIVSLNVKDQGFLSMENQNNSSLFDLTKDTFLRFQSNLPNLSNKHLGFHSKHLIKWLSQKVGLLASVK